MKNKLRTILSFLSLWIAGSLGLLIFYLLDRYWLESDYALNFTLVLECIWSLLVLFMSSAPPDNKKIVRANSLGKGIAYLIIFISFTTLETWALLHDLRLFLDGKKADAKIVRIIPADETRYRSKLVEVRFLDENRREWYAKLPKHFSDHRNSTLKISYDQNDPPDAARFDPWVLLFICAILYMLLMALFTIRKELKLRKKIAYLKVFGQSIQATIIHVRETSKTSDLRYGQLFWVEAEGQDPLVGRKRNFESERYGHDLRPYVGRHITVLLDSTDRDWYYVDVPSLA